MSFCPSCGSPLAPGARFCTSCGGQTSGGTPSATPNTPLLAEHRGSGAYPPQQPQQQQQQQQPYPPQQQQQPQQGSQDFTQGPGSEKDASQLQDGSASNPTDIPTFEGYSGVGLGGQPMAPPPKYEEVAIPERQAMPPPTHITTEEATAGSCLLS